MDRFAPNLRLFSLLAVVGLSIFFLLAIAVNSARGADTAIPNETVHLSYFATGSTKALGALSITTATAGDGELVIPDGDSAVTFTTGVYQPGIDLTTFGVKLIGENFDHTSEHGVEVTAHFVGADGNRDYDLSGVSDHTKAALPSTLYVTEPITASDLESYSVTITLNRNNDGSAPRVQDLEIISLDSSTEDLLPPVTAGYSLMSAEEITAASATTVPDIISRAEWGADEAYRYDSNGDEIWPRQIDNVKAFIVHHTAGGDGGGDPAATIRGIYYWHSQVLGWGDIGYNYLIDKDGNIYKGRKGGDGVVGAHTYNSVDMINYNEGSIGIALMGCYDDDGCNTLYEITPKMETALTNLIGYKASELGIKPKSTVTFHGAEANRIGGHQDFDYTLCPGNTVLGDMTTIRDSAQDNYDTYSTQPLQASLIDIFAYTTPVGDDETATEVDASLLTRKTPYTVTVSYTNSGTSSWSQSAMNLRLLKKSGRGVTPLRHVKSWAHRYGKITMNEESVQAGETATFTFRIRAQKKPRTRGLMLKLYSERTFVTNSQSTSSFTFAE